MASDIKSSDIVFRGNENLKPANAVEYVDQATWEFRAKEIIKCKNDINYFANTYFTIISPKKGMHIIETFKKQDEFLKCLCENNRVICLSSRQSAKTTSYTIFALHYAIFNEAKSILIAANKNSTALGILERIKLAYEHLPNWLKCGIKTWNKGSVEFGNKSKIEGVATASDAARSKACNCLILDEFAFIPPNIAQTFWTSVYPIVSSAKNTKVIIVSSPNGTGNLYYEMYESARLGIDKEGFKSFRIDWWEFPGRDAEWVAEQKAALKFDETAWNQEFGNEFIGSSYTLIKPEDVTRYKNFVLSPKWFPGTKIKFEGNNFEYTQWFKPEKDHVYILGCDTADGIGSDFSVILVLDITDSKNIRLAASFYHNRISTMEFPYTVARLAQEYNSAFIAMESNGIGEGVLNMLRHVYMYDNIIVYGESKDGIFSHVQVKAEACRWLRDITNMPDTDIHIELYEKELVAEMEWFEKSKVKIHDVYKAVNTRHDDFMMALIWAVFCLKPAILDDYFDVDGYFKTSKGMEMYKRLRSYSSSSYFGDLQKEFNKATESDFFNADKIHKNIQSGRSDLIHEDKPLSDEDTPKNLGFTGDEYAEIDKADKSW